MMNNRDRLLLSCIDATTQTAIGDPRLVRSKRRRTPDGFWFSALIVVLTVVIFFL